LDSDHLLAVLLEHDGKEWRPETFQIIKTILEERKVALPSQQPENPAPKFVTEISVSKGLGALLSASTPKKITVRFCEECGHRVVSSGKWLESWGGLLGVVGILGAFGVVKGVLEILVQT
jgi:hypothetical protein